MPRFVVLEHDSPRGLHWDLMLHQGAALATWALPQPPDAPGPLPAERLPDHRLAYLDYEGPVSGDRGQVVRWDTGSFELVNQSDDQWTVVFQGQRLRGEMVLRRLSGEVSMWEFRLQDEPRRGASQ